MKRETNLDLLFSIEPGKSDLLSNDEITNASYEQLQMVLVDPLVLGTSVLDRSILFTEPKSNLSLGRLDRVRAVADVATDVDGTASEHVNRIRTSHHG